MIKGSKKWVTQRSTCVTDVEKFLSKYCEKTNTKRFKLLGDKSGSGEKFTTWLLHPINDMFSCHDPNCSIPFALCNKYCDDTASDAEIHLSESLDALKKFKEKHHIEFILVLDLKSLWSFIGYSTCPLCNKKGKFRNGGNEAHDISKDCLKGTIWDGLVDEVQICLLHLKQRITEQLVTSLSNPQTFFQDTSGDFKPMLSTPTMDVLKRERFLTEYCQKFKLNIEFALEEHPEEETQSIRKIKMLMGPDCNVLVQNCSNIIEAMENAGFEVKNGIKQMWKLFKDILPKLYQKNPHDQMESFVLQLTQQVATFTTLARAHMSTYSIYVHILNHLPKVILALHQKNECIATFENQSIESHHSLNNRMNQRTVFKGNKRMVSKNSSDGSMIMQDTSPTKQMMERRWFIIHQEHFPFKNTAQLHLKAKEKRSLPVVHDITNVIDNLPSRKRKRETLKTSKRALISSHEYQIRQLYQ